MIKTLGELKKQIGEIIINCTCKREPEVLYYRQYDDDPLFVVTIRAFRTDEFDEKGK